MNVHFLPDQPIVDKINDALGFDPFLDVLERAIYHTTPPFTYGVLGDWGTGKTSVMHLLQRRLAKKFETNQQPVIPIWFNAWKYENETNIIYPLLHAIKEEHDRRTASFLDEISRKPFMDRLKTVTVTSALALTDMGLRATTRHLTGEALKLGDISDTLEKVQAAQNESEQGRELATVFRNWADQVSQLEVAFDNLLQAFAQDMTKGSDTPFPASEVRFVILIDDLDRCLPETTIRILEGIKNFLLTDKAIFVLALNPAVIYKGIAVKYRGLEINGREYLEKILNYSFRVPEPQLTHVGEFVTVQFKRLLPAEADQQTYQTHFQTFGRAMSDCRFTNPRKIKRILNRYLLFLQLYANNPDYHHQGNIIRLIVLAEYYPALFNLYLNDMLPPPATARGGINLRQVGESSFILDAFEAYSGLSIRPIFAELQTHKELFDLSARNDVSVKGHAQAVQRSATGV